MANVTGIGGIFLRAKDPDALSQWYGEALGIDFIGGGHFSMFTEETPGSVTVFSLFDHDDSYIGDPQRQSVMVNYRVDDLDAMVARLTSLGAVVDDILVEEHGRFAWSTDPEGNRFELWEPGEAD
jgi:predicted enzyme related to lactoylglutathione lyase